MFAVLMLSLCLASGCPGGGSDGPKRQAFQGKVTREGIPIDDGSIVFRAEGGGANISASSPIVNGEYRFDKESGVPAGKYKVEIFQRPLRDPSFVGKKNEAPLLEDTRFKNKMPEKGWVKSAEVAENQEAPINFEVDEGSK